MKKTVKRMRLKKKKKDWKVPTQKFKMAKYDAVRDKNLEGHFSKSVNIKHLQDNFLVDKFHRIVYPPKDKAKGTICVNKVWLLAEKRILELEKKERINLIDRIRLRQRKMYSDFHK